MRLNILIVFTVFLAKLCSAQPIIELGNDTTVCGTSFLLETGSIEPHLWSDGSSGITLLVTTSGEYSVSVTDAMGTSIDTIGVFFESVPSNSVNDTIFCDGGAIELSTVSDGEYIFWYDSLGSNLILEEGSTYNTSVFDTTTYYVEALNFSDQRRVFGYSSNTGNILGNSRGLVFDVHEPLILDSLTVFKELAGNITIRLEDHSGNILNTISNNVPNGGYARQTIPIGFFIRPGTGYRLIISGNSGKIGRVSGASYPQGITGLMSITGGLNISSVVSNQWYGLFDLQIKADNCSTGLIPVNVFVVPNPVPNLGPDTSFCNLSSIILDAGNLGADYLWSDGSASQQLQASMSGNYGVTMTNGGVCSVTDDINLQFLNEAIINPINDTFLCVADTLNIDLEEIGYVYEWYSDSNSTIPVYSGNKYNPFISESSTIYYEVAPVALTITGLTEPDSSIVFGNFIISTQFEALENVILDSIAVYSNGTTMFDLEIRDGSNTLVFQNTYFIGSGKSFLGINLFLLEGENYSIQFANLSGANLAFGGTVSYPFTDDASRISILGNSISTSTVYYFYDWHLSYAFEDCRTTRDSFIVNVNHELILPELLDTCYGYIIDPMLIGGVYSWSTGESTPTIAPDTSGLYSFTFTDANCILEDSIVIQLPYPLSLQDDGVLCGGVLTEIYPVTASYLWSTGETSTSITPSGPGTYSLTVTNSAGCDVIDSVVVTSIEPFPEVFLGNDSNFCVSAILDAENSGSMFLWNDGSTDQFLNISASGIYSVSVTNSSGCVSVDSISLTIEQPPQSNFSYNVNPGNIVDFTNFSTSGSYQWFFGDSTSSNLTDPSHLYANGTYEVMLITSNNCGSDTSSQMILISGNTTLNLPKSTFKVFPVPAKTSINIVCEEQLSGTAVIEIVDLYGQIRTQETIEIMNQGDSYELDIQSLNYSVFFIRIKTETGLWTTRIIKK